MSHVPSNKELKLTKPGTIGASQLIPVFDGPTGGFANDSFLDEDALVIEDPDHSDTEDRFILLGLSGALRVLFVCHCVRESGSVIRIISARRADRFEQKQYTERLRK